MTASPPESGDRQLGVLAKYWDPGKVKTRLIPYFGASNAAALHQIFLETTLRRFTNLADRQVLCFTPEAHRSSFEAMAADQWDLLPQQEGDLGARIAGYFHDAFACGNKRVLLIGADTPHLPAPYIEEAFVALEQHDLVFVVSEDGGYCLVGASRPVDPLTTDIDWGSSRVWEQTRKKIEALGWSVRQLPSWYDIDRCEDVKQLQRDFTTHPLIKLPARDTCLYELQAKLKKICG